MDLIYVTNDKTGKVQKHDIEKMIAAVTGSVANQWSENMDDFKGYYNLFYSRIEKKINQFQGSCCWSQLEDIVDAMKPGEIKEDELC
jgi:hypothetical protein